MELDSQIKLGHLLLSDRKCRVCGEEKNLIECFYRTRKILEQDKSIEILNVHGEGFRLIVN